MVNQHWIDLGVTIVPGDEDVAAGRQHIPDTRSCFSLPAAQEVGTEQQRQLHDVDSVSLLFVPKRQARLDDHFRNDDNDCTHHGTAVTSAASDEPDPEHVTFFDAQQVGKAQVEGAALKARCAIHCRLDRCCILYDEGGNQPLSHC